MPSSLLLGHDGTMDWLEKKTAESEKKEEKKMLRKNNVGKKKNL